METKDEAAAREKFRVEKNKYLRGRLSPSPERKREIVRYFLGEREYETADFNGMKDSTLEEICRIAAEDLYDEFGPERLTEFFDTPMRTRETDSTSWYARNWYVVWEYGYRQAILALTAGKDDHPPGAERFHLACHLCMILLLHGDEYRQETGRKYLQTLARRGSEEAKKLVESGSGKIAPDVLRCQDHLVTCAANDILNVVDLKTKEESEAAYRTMLDYLIRLIQAEFPKEYHLKFNSKEKTWIRGIPKTPAQVFWNNCARYPALFPRMREYIRAIRISDGVAGSDVVSEYYRDASDEAAVPVGGYAAFALGLADPSHGDIVVEFMLHNDEEHALAPNHFVLAYFDKFGIHPENMEPVLACILNINENEARPRGKIAGLDDAPTLAALLLAISRYELDGYDVSRIVDYLWGGREKLAKAAKKAEDGKKEHLARILALVEE
ncbi:MAG: DUF6138 family protein [Zoogloeaceae bacterium]|jgi:hypothetical protein|nr:DUF6138 family protein [Zoogloeaceae bacterium]